MRSSTRHCIILATVTILVWMTGAFGQFVWIDHVEIEQAGYRITSWDDFQLVWTTSLDSYLERESGEPSASGGYFRPIYAMFVSADWFLWGDQPLPYHLSNILVHTLVVIGLYFLGRQLLPDPKNAFVVFAATLLFAIHPFGVHSVTWISGRKDSLCALFSIVCLIGFGKLLNDLKYGSSFGKGLIILVSVISLNLGLLCKELAIVTPAFATVWMWTASRRDANESSDRIQPPAVALLVLFWISSIGAIVYRKVLLGGIGLNIDYPANSLAENFVISCKLVGWYIVRTLVPIEPTIVDRWPVVVSIDLSTIATLISLACLVGLIVWSLARRKKVGLLFCWFAIWLIPATGLVPLRHMYAERYLYPASWGLLLAMLYVVQPWLDRMANRRAVFSGFVVAVAILFSIQTIVTNRYWRSDASLFTHSIKQNSEYAEGLSAIALDELKKENYQRSLEFGDRAIESANDANYRSYWSPFGVYSNAGLAAFYLKDFDQAESLLEKAKTYRPNNALSNYHLGLVAEATNRKADAVAFYEEAILIKPNHHLSRVNLGHILLTQQKFQECIAILQPTVASEPGNRLVHVNIATAYLVSKDFAAAETHFEAAIKIEPNDAINLAKLAWSEFEQGKKDEAQLHLTAAKKMLPDNPTIQFVTRTYENSEK